MRRYFNFEVISSVYSFTLKQISLINKIPAPWLLSTPGLGCYLCGLVLRFLLLAVCSNASKFHHRLQYEQEISLCPSKIEFYWVVQAHANSSFCLVVSGCEIYRIQTFLNGRSSVKMKKTMLPEIILSISAITAMVKHSHFWLYEYFEM